MKEKILNSKITWILLVLLLITLIIILITTNTKDDKIINNNQVNNTKKVEINDSDVVKTKVTYNFELKGSSIINIYENDEYEECGYLAVDSNNIDLSNYVKISGEVDTRNPGKYELTYTLNIDNYSKTLKRTINVLKKKQEELVMSLNGDSVVYLNKSDTYNELGVTAKIGTLDVSKNVVITSNYVKGIVGNYVVNYVYQDELRNNSLKRNIIVIDIDSYFKVEDNTIKITLDDNIKYLVLPNGTLNTNKTISYNVSKSDTYKFKLYTNDFKSYEKNITIDVIENNNNIPNNNNNNSNNQNIVDKTPPSGVCTKILDSNGTTIFNVISSDNDIASYNYSNIKSTKEPSLTVNGFIRDKSYVILTDTSGNKSSNITCNTSYRTTEVITPKSGETIKYKSLSNSLKVYVTTKDGFYLTRVWMLDPIYQLRKQIISGKSVELPLTLMKNAVNNNKLSSKIVLGFNASGIVTKTWYSDLINKDKSYTNMEPISLIITNGKVTKNDYKNYSADYPIYYINNINQLSYIPRIGSKSSGDRKKIFQDVIDGGAYNTFGFTKSVFVENSKVNNNVSYSGDYIALRQAICQIDTNNFILITSNTKTILRQPFANYLGTLGCKTAFNLDGGGSTTLMYKSGDSSSINVVKGGKRAVTMILYFTELS